MHAKLAGQIREALMNLPVSDLDVQQIGEVNEAAENATEFELWGNDNRRYMVSVMVQED